MECPFLRRCGYYPHRQNCANGSYTTLGPNMFFYIANCLPDHNFPFSIFNFTFN